jgi:hypothetical protein
MKFTPLHFKFYLNKVHNLNLFKDDCKITTNVILINKISPFLNLFYKDFEIYLSNTKKYTYSIFLVEDYFVHIG